MIFIVYRYIDLVRYDMENWKIGNIDVKMDIIENLLNFVKNFSYIYWMFLGK